LLIPNFTAIFLTVSVSVLTSNSSHPYLSILMVPADTLLTHMVLWLYPAQLH